MKWGGTRRDIATIVGPDFGLGHDVINTDLRVDGECRRRPGMIRYTEKLAHVPRHGVGLPAGNLKEKIVWWLPVGKGVTAIDTTDDDILWWLTDDEWVPPPPPPPPPPPQENPPQEPIWIWLRRDWPKDDGPQQQQILVPQDYRQVDSASDSVVTAVSLPDTVFEYSKDATITVTVGGAIPHNLRGAPILVRWEYKGDSGQSVETLGLLASGSVGVVYTPTCTLAVADAGETLTVYACVIDKERKQLIGNTANDAAVVGSYTFQVADVGEANAWTDSGGGGFDWALYSGYSDLSVVGDYWRSDADYAMIWLGVIVPTPTDYDPLNVSTNTGASFQVDISISNAGASLGDRVIGYSLDAGSGTEWEFGYRTVGTLLYLSIGGVDVWTDTYSAACTFSITQVASGAQHIRTFALDGSTIYTDPAAVTIDYNLLAYAVRSTVNGADHIDIRNVKPAD